MLRKLRRSMQSESGFTLIELLVVIAIMGILAGVAVPRLLGVTNKAKDAGIASVAGSIKTGMEIYYLEHSQLYPTSTVIDGTDTWGDLQTTIDTLSSEDLITDYNIGSITYTPSTDQKAYLIVFTSASDSTKNYYLGELGYSDLASEASTVTPPTTTT